MSDNNELWTLSRIAQRLRVERHRIEYLIDSRGIAPVDRAGIVRLFDDNAVARITEELRRSDADRKGVRA